MAWLQVQQRGREPIQAETPSACRLSLYEEVPEELISIEEFESVAIDRLRVLKAVEDDKARGFSVAQRQERTKLLVRKHLSGADAFEAERKDLVSHFVLRLAYCRTADLRQWFLVQECDLFKLRFALEPTSSQIAFLKTHGTDLAFEELSAAESEQVKPALVQTLNAQQQRDAAAEMSRTPGTDAYFKVPWQHVPDLVAMRRVYLRHGTAYVHRRDMGSVVQSHFKARLCAALDLTARKWLSHLAAEEEGRLAPIVNGLSQRYLGPDFSSLDNASKAAITYSQLPALSKQSFPLCMQRMFDGLRQEHHLKHAARQQLGLFLKGIGLPLEEALRFWRTEFGPKTPSEKFDKEYAYNVRHNYGKEGKRTDYTPYSCIKIISAAPGAGDYHGCPYKTMSPDQLAARLAQSCSDGELVRQIVSKARDGHYQLACGLAFEGAHNCSCDTGINHPNQYFVESRKVIDGPAEAGKPDASEAAGSEPMQT